MTDEPASARPAPRCPICGRQSVAELAPFCSKACRGRDLLAWLDERYVLPVAEADALAAPRPVEPTPDGEPER
jgi:hypothetical protein